MISDIRGSTKAVSEGRYREVNVCGAATVAMVQEKLGTRAFPFVFGGDGATLLLPHDLFEKLRDDFERLISKIHRDFGMELRVGWVPYAELKSLGASVEVGRLRLSPSNSLATLKGPGVTLAEKLIKSEEKYLLKGAARGEELSLSKLSCRFRPIHSRKDTVVSLLVFPLPTADPGKFGDFLGRFRRYLVEPHFKPLDANLGFDRFWPAFSKERKITGRFWSSLFRIAAFKLMSWISERFRSSRIGRAVYGYFADIPANSDYQKFDGVLRTVIDCTIDEKRELLQLLEEFKSVGALQFGFSESKVAVMTCLVDDIDGGEHIHFIDGGDGGYTLAAKAMKNSTSNRVPGS